MSGRGRIVDVQRRNEPKSNRPALLLVTDYDAPIGPDHLERNAVWIGEADPHPQVGDLISWGPRHVQWGACKLPKVGSDCDPNDPALYTG